MQSSHFANIFALYVCFATYEYLDARVFGQNLVFQQSAVTSFLPDDGMRSIVQVCPTKTLYIHVGV